MVWLQGWSNFKKYIPSWIGCIILQEKIKKIYSETKETLTLIKGNQAQRSFQVGKDGIFIFKKIIHHQLSP